MPTCVARARGTHRSDVPAHRPAGPCRESPWQVTPPPPLPLLREADLSLPAGLHGDHLELLEGFAPLRPLGAHGIVERLARRQWRRPEGAGISGLLGPAAGKPQFGVGWDVDGNPRRRL